MPHSGPKVASKRIARFQPRAAELRRKASVAATKERRAVLLEQAEMFERIVKEAERDSQEAGFGDFRHDPDR